jgi:hypothetical protein
MNCGIHMRCVRLSMTGDTSESFNLKSHETRIFMTNMSVIFFLNSLLAIRITLDVM